MKINIQTNHFVCNVSNTIKAEYLTPEFLLDVTNEERGRFRADSLYHSGRLGVIAVVRITSYKISQSEVAVLTPVQTISNAHFYSKYN